MSFAIGYHAKPDQPPTEFYVFVPGGQQVATFKTRAEVEAHASYLNGGLHPDLTQALLTMLSRTGAA